MKIGVDIRALQVGHEFRGIGANVRGLLEGLMSNSEFSKHQIFFYMYESTNPLETIRIPEGFSYKTILMKNPKDPRDNITKAQKAFAFAKEILVNHILPNNIPKTSRLDVYLQFDQALGLPRNPLINKIVMVYDLIPLVFRADYMPSARSVWRKHNWRAALRTWGLNIRYKAGLRVVKRANKIITISETSAHDIQRYLKISTRKIIVATCSLPTVASKKPVDLRETEDGATIQGKDRIVDQILREGADIPYLLYVGGVESPRRRIEDLIAAYHQLRAAGTRIRLVLVGREFSDPNKIPSPQASALLKQLSYKEDLFMLGYLDDIQKDKLYSKAAAFVFISLYEGFGLPILESFEKGCPVVTYDNSSIREVAGDAAIYCDTNVEALVSALQGVITGKTKVSRENMNNQLEKFSWTKSARIISKAILK